MKRYYLYLEGGIPPAQFVTNLLKKKGEKKRKEEEEKRKKHKREVIPIP